MLLDANGCPTEGQIMGPLAKGKGEAKDLVANFDAFKFPSSEVNHGSNNNSFQPCSFPDGSVPGPCHPLHATLPTSGVRVPGLLWRRQHQVIIIIIIIIIIVIITIVIIIIIIKIECIAWSVWCLGVIITYQDKDEIR